MKHTPQGETFTRLVIEAFKINELLTIDGDAICKLQGVTNARWKILGCIADDKSQLTVPQIARKLGQSRQAVQRLANLMEAEELLIFTENPQHKRANFLELTQKGLTVFSNLMEVQTPLVNRQASQIPLEDLENALRIMQKISAVIESEHER
ncbi:MAG: helix-turn-helix domain-containing protein [Cellvibrio sp.]|uniref:MarR family winged helix-turn-helix transcriptional regulator n=1 Tax=Cellvibrio sp. TaxID=1965322 RepID=UPI00319FC8B8